MRIPYASLEAFKAKASLLESLLKLKGRRRTLELLSRLSGYASYHEVSHADLTSGQMPRVGQVAAQLLAAFPDKGPSEARRVAEALGLHLERKAGTRAKTAQETMFDALYVTKTPVDKTALLKFECLKHCEGGESMLSFDPSKQAQDLKRMRTPLFYLRTHELRDHHPDLPQISEFFDAIPDFTPTDDELSEWWSDELEYTVYPKYTGQPAPKDLTDEEREVLWNFWLKSSDEVAKNHGILSRIPDVVRLAELWKPYHVEAYALIVAAASPSCTVLVGETPVPQGAHWALTDGLIKCSIAFKQSAAAGLEKDDKMSMWEYSACFVMTGKGLSRAKPIALMTGTHIVPFRTGEEGYEPVDSEYFADVMDSHSAMLNDVWKVLQFNYFVAQGYDEVEEFAWNRMDEAFTVASLEIAPELRGKDLAPLLFNLFITTVARYPSSELDAGWARACGLPEEDEDEVTLLNLGNPGVLILPVEGSEPGREPISPLNVFLAQSPRKVQVVDKVPEVERRKEKLTAHFQGMQAQVEADIVVYDPWEYPMT